MKSKILALSNNKEFQELIKKKRISNKYITIYFGKLDNKDIKKLNISFSVKITPIFPPILDLPGIYNIIIFILFMTHLIHLSQETL